MAHLTNHKTALKQIIDSGIRCFAIYNDPAKKTLLAEDKTGNLTPEQCSQVVDELLSSYSGLVYLELAYYSKEEKAQGNQKGGPTQYPLIPIQLGTSGTGINGLNTPAVNTTGLYTQEQVDRLLNEKELRHSQDINHLKATHALQVQIDQLKNAKDEDKTGKYLEMYAPAINGIITKYFGTNQVAVAGVNPPAKPANENTHAAEEVTRVIENALDRILAVDPEFPNVLVKIADMAENEPDKYNMAKNLLA